MCQISHVSYKRYPSLGGGSTKSVLSDRLIVYTKSRKQLLHRGTENTFYMKQAVLKEKPGSQ